MDTTTGLSVITRFKYHAMLHNVLLVVFIQHPPVITHGYILCLPVMIHASWLYHIILAPFWCVLRCMTL